MSRDNTMLARLGFQDPDRKSGRHDEICREVYADAEGIISMAYAQSGRVIGDARDFKPELERPLLKGEGKYQTIVGYLDVVVGWDEGAWNYYGYPYRKREWNVGGKIEYHTNERDHLGRAWTEKGYRDVSGPVREVQHPWVPLRPFRIPSPRVAVIEVKTGRVDLGDWLRQMKTYMTFTSADLWVLLAPNMTDTDVKIFADSGVTALTWPE